VTDRIYGPYYKANGRSFVSIVSDDKKKRSQTYPRYLMEQHLGRKLLSSEQVHHINGDPLDDRIENLEVVSYEKHRETHKAEIVEAVCPECFKDIEVLGHEYRFWQEKRNAGGPFCSRACANKYNARKRAESV